jgi:hypothetical protein
MNSASTDTWFDNSGALRQRESPRRLEMMFEIARRLRRAKDIFVLLCLATLTVAAPTVANSAET